MTFQIQYPVNLKSSQSEIMLIRVIRVIWFKIVSFCSKSFSEPPFQIMLIRVIRVIRVIWFKIVSSCSKSFSEHPFQILLIRVIRVILFQIVSSCSKR
jgi:acetolactate synthase regulatory subunit